MVQRAYLEIDLDQLRRNIGEISRYLSSHTKIMCVIKTNAYGHGSVQVASAVESLDVVEGFAVATVSEAMELRNAGIYKRILLLGFCFEEELETLIANDITVTCFQERIFLEASRIATLLGKECSVHVKVDTGMSRLGVLPDNEGLEMLHRVNQLPNINIEGMFTHFACADQLDQKMTKKQSEVFDSYVTCVQKQLNRSMLLRHSSNSAGILTNNGADLDFVRAGIILYGIHPSKEVSLPNRIKPILSFKSTIILLKRIPANTAVSYGATYVTDKERLIATIPVGYGDGYPRDLSNKGSVLVRGQKVSIVGRICMDYFMIDVSSVEQVQEGDVVTLIGRDGEEEITIEDISQNSSHFYYEIPCCLTNRVKRIYRRNDELLEV
ncbi:MAG: alanine racemase [Eubacteriales bacterium]